MGDTNKPTQLSMASKFDNPNHPLYLHHSDQPGLVLVSQVLTEENYNVWNHSMTVALMVKNKYGFVDESILRPNEDAEDKLQQWIRCNNLIKTWILGSLSKEIAASVFYCEGAKAIWDELYKRFSQVNNIQVLHIENEIHDCIQGTMSISSYFTRLKGLWDEKDVLFPIAACQYGTMKEELSY
ncbi:uncharacterized protein LOC113780438 [Coffea eugenioides]|uniref:uncharacterized protein LOC113774482 n=1 Tax=Coffea eugenioides TaxID=49369 RepID=UPI000F60506C|nr:uncharacterized protein LOC113774482 [Coffea eugenioides]XP_027182041.1 uncharacterized protein LOC113780438 [Coffea eugenioides]